MWLFSKWVANMRVIPMIQGDVPMIQPNIHYVDFFSIHLLFSHTIFPANPTFLRWWPLQFWFHHHWILRSWVSLLFGSIKFVPLNYASYYCLFYLSLFFSSVCFLRAFLLSLVLLNCSLSYTSRYNGVAFSQQNKNLSLHCPPFIIRNCSLKRWFFISTFPVVFPMQKRWK